MNKSACSAVICQPGGHKQNHNIGAQCGATAPENCTSTSYSEPNPKFSQPNPTAGGRFQTIQTI